MTSQHASSFQIVACDLDDPQIFALLGTQQVSPLGVAPDECTVGLSVSVRLRSPTDLSRDGLAGGSASCPSTRVSNTQHAPSPNSPGSCKFRLKGVTSLSGGPQTSPADVLSAVILNSTGSGISCFLQEGANLVVVSSATTLKRFCSSDDQNM